MLSMMNNFEKNLNAHEQRMLILEKSLLKFEKEILNPLSQNKKTFLENPEYLYQMHASDLFALTDHYWKKNIPIIFNGATPEKYALILKKNEALPAEKQDIGLTGDEIFDEMLHIQNLLKKNNDSRFIGYISTNGVIKTKKHFDYFIISKDEIMLPVFYDISFNIRDRSHSKLLRYYIYKSNLHGFGGSGLHPQADSTSCGSLGLASLKKLLQNDAYELKNRTLSVRFYDKNEILRSYFFTSPKVLQFSQSSKFNQALKDLLMNDEETINNGMYSLKSTLKNSIQIAKRKMTEAIENKDQESYQENTAILAANEATLTRLPEFRKAWMKDFLKMEEYRNKFYVKTHPYKAPLNYYLNYKTSKYEKMRQKLFDKEGKESANLENTAEKVSAFIKLFSS